MIDPSGEPTQRTLRLRKALLAVVVLLSAFVQFTVVTGTTAKYPVQSDAIKYVAYAWNLKHHGTFSHASFWVSPEPTNPPPDKMALPGYPAFLSMFLHDTVDQAYVSRITLMQAAMGVLTCVLVLAAALRMLPFGLAIAAGLLTALSPHLATISTNLLTESLFTVLLAASLFLGVLTVTGAGRWNAYAAGALLGIASLVRPQMQLFPWLLLALCLAIPTWRLHWRKAAVALTCFLAITVPWNLRNLGVERQPGEPDLLAMTVYHGAFPGLMYENHPETAGYAYQFDRDSARHSKDLPSAMRFAADGFEQFPARYLGWYLVGKPISFLSWNDPANATDIYIYKVTRSPYDTRPLFTGILQAMRVLHWPLTLLTLACVALAAWRPGQLAGDPHQRTAIRLLSLVVGYVLVMHMLGAPFGRYSVPFRPLVYLLAMAMLASIVRSLRSRHSAH